MIYRPTLIALLGLSLILASCGGGSTTPPKDPDPIVPTTVTLQGSISDWKGGTGSLSVFASDSSEVAKTTTLDAQGKFSINVPKDPTNLKILASESLSKPLVGAYNCSITKNVTIGDNQTKILEISSAKFTKDITNISLGATKSTINTSPPPPLLGLTTIVGSEYIYADRPTTVKGTLEVTCTQSAVISLPKTLKISLTIDLNYVKGWNNQEIKASSELGFVDVAGNSELQATLTGTIQSLTVGSTINFYTN